MSQNEPKINPATGYAHDDSQLEDKPRPVVEQPSESEPEENQEASE